MKYIILTIMLVVCSLLLNGQEINYYKGKSVITSDLYEYNVKDIGQRRVLLSNTQNELFDIKKWTYKNGSPNVYPGSVKPGVEPDNMKVFYDAFRSVFTIQEIEQMKQGISGGVVYYDDDEREKTIPVDQISFTIYSVVSSAGELLELEIHFPNITVFNTINPDKMFALEQALKEEGRVIFKIPEKTKELVDYVIGISVRVRISDL